MGLTATARHPALIFGALALAIVAAGGWFDRVQHRALLGEAEEKVQSIARLEARSILEWRRALQRHARGAAESWSPLAGRDTAGLRKSLEAFRAGGAFMDVAVLGPPGTPSVVAGSWAEGIPERPAGWDRPHPVITPVRRVGAAWVIHVFAPVGADHVAVFRADVRDGVEPLLGPWATPAHGSSRLLRKGGDVLVDPENDPSAEGPVIEASASVEGSDWVVAAVMSRTDLEQPGSARRPVLALLVVALVAAAGMAVQARTRRERLHMLERSWRAERRARLMHEEQARIVEVFDDPVLILNPDRRVRFWNEAAARLYGFSAAEAIGRPVAEVTGAELLGDAELPEALRDGRPRRRDVEHRRRDGTPVQVDVTGVALRDGDQVLSGVLAICRDRTVRLQDEAGRRAMEAQLAQADRMASMGLVAASVAHEMATPLAYVLTSLRYAKEELGHPAPSLVEVRSALQDAEEGGERVRRIVEEVRTFSRSGNDREGPADVARVVESALRLSAAELRHRARAATDVPPALRVALGADQLGQVVLNLVMNAAQAIPPGDPARNAVRISARRDGEEVLLEVADTGAGIPPEVAARIFEPFFTTKPRGVGTGLGLSICRRLVEDAGGALTFETAAGAGTTFRVRLPAAAAHPAAARARLLLVSGEVRAARALAHGLEADLEVHLESDPRRAAARLSGGELFEVILCDAVLPGTDGLSLLEETSRLHPVLRERFVFLAGAGAPGNAALREAGYAVLERPLEASVVCRLVLGRIGTARQVA